MSDDADDFGIPRAVIDALAADLYAVFAALAEVEYATRRGVPAAPDYLAALLPRWDSVPEGHRDRWRAVARRCARLVDSAVMAGDPDEGILRRVGPPTHEFALVDGDLPAAEAAWRARLPDR